MTSRGKLDVWPLAILGGLLFAGLALATISVEDGLPMLAYLPIVVILAVVLYVKGIKPVDDDFPPSLFALAVGAKLASTIVYYWFILDVYGRGDANAYHREAQTVAPLLAQLDFSALGRFAYGRQGSTNIIYVMGSIYNILPPSRQGGGLLFAMLALGGSVLFYRAFRVAFPEAKPGFYRLVIFFLPSIVFWTSAVGKDAWVFMSSGVVAYGLAVYARQTRISGLGIAGLGLGAIYLARPHIAAFMILAAGIAFLLFYRVNSSRRLAVWLAGAAVILVGGAFVLRSASEFLGLGPLSEVTWLDVEGFYDFRQQVSSTGGSSFAPQAAYSLMGFVSAPVVTLFRPFPWEAHNAQATITSWESVLWLALFWWRRRVFWERFLSIRRDPWVAFALGYSAIMIVALTTAGNFGIIARQRVAFLPFLWVLFG